MQKEITPSLTLEQTGGGTIVTAAGVWQVHALARPGVMAELTAMLDQLKGREDLQWELSGASSLDHIGAQLFWNSWGRKRPARLVLSPGQDSFFHRIEVLSALPTAPVKPDPYGPVIRLGQRVLLFMDHLWDVIKLIGAVTQDLGRFLRAPHRGPWREISANIFHAGFQALGITALVGFLIGVVLSYLSAQQLRNFGGDVYIVNILGMSIVRELGPLLAAILVAGRSGSSITAQLGVMRVTEELDAMLVMGISHGYRLILPKVIALAISMPLLVVWTDAMALLGGAVSAKIELNLSLRYFIDKLPSAVPIANYHIGLLKGAAFGMLIALVSCHFGLRIKPNTESLGRGTTTSVVTAITVVILADAVFAILFNNVGYYR
ncbi:ABC transporter permease [Massilia sp. TS11]|uniref:MlaE family ABC transporter permease n=1 Tax=Massilia sp. TS11 TaxID=2908003 RepID=UPI001EDC73D4|nr:ABC transporter permease [Massilia sp. TS11]MCG2586599.1 ABC transporter permease [Massilia sp. TS11]